MARNVEQGRLKAFGYILGCSLMTGCLMGGNSPSEEKTTPVEQTDSTKFKAGLYQGKTTVYGLDIVNYVYLHADGKYAMAQFQKLEDYDSLVCRFVIRGGYTDSGDTISFSKLQKKFRPIDSLKNLNLPFSEWDSLGDNRSAKKDLYKDFGHDFFVTLEVGGDSKGNYWSENIDNKWIATEDAPWPMKTGMDSL